MWTCPKCKRAFTRKNQRHACGIGDVAAVLEGRPETLVDLYRALEAFARDLGPIELVGRNRYVLFRSRRIFADLVVMTDALRVAVHLPRRVRDAIFFKVVADHRQASHVAKLRTPKELSALLPYLREAYAFSLSSEKANALHDKTESPRGPLPRQGAIKKGARRRPLKSSASTAQ